MSYKISVIKLLGLLIALAVCFSGCGAIHTTTMTDLNKIQFGTASWYGNEFHGCKTKSGEKYNKNEFTAAHKTLPFGTFVRVTNTKNGRSVIVKINDRGPWKRNRKIDLSYAAAQKIGMLADGVARVRLDVVDKKAGEILWYEQGEGWWKNAVNLPDTLTSGKRSWSVNIRNTAYNSQKRLNGLPGLAEIKTMSMACLER